MPSIRSSLPFAILLLLAVAVLATAWLLRDAQPPPPASAPALSTAPGAAEAAATEPDSPTTNVDEPPPPRVATDDHGGLDVTVRCGERQLPAVVVDVHDADGGLRGTAVTDEGGVARFQRLPVGVGTAQVRERPAPLGVAVDFTLTAGVRTAVTIEVAPPGWIRGTVRFAPGGDVTTARVWSAAATPFRGDGIDVVQPAPDGRFEVPAWGTIVLGATAPLRVPVHRELNVAVGSTEDVELVLRAGGAALRGLVQSEAGAPIAAAEVQVGMPFGDYAGHLRDDGVRESIAPVLRTTDADGRFDVPGTVTGRVTVVAAARGFARSEQDVDLVAGTATDVVLTLARGAVVQGTVRRSDGAVAIDAEVRVAGSGIGRSRTRTALDGSYRLHDVAPGTQQLVASTPGWGTARTLVEAEPRVVHTWDPTLTGRWQSVRGRLQDAAGNPLADWWVVLQNDQSLWLGSPVRTGVDGSFEWARLAAVEAVFSVRVHAPTDQLAGGRPTTPTVLHVPRVTLGDDIVVTVPTTATPTAWIRGRVVAPQSNPHLHLIVRGDGGGQFLVNIAADSTFAIGPLVAGRWHLGRLHGNGMTILRSVDVERGGNHDLGTIDMQATRPGTVIAAVDAFTLPPGAAIEFAGRAALHVSSAATGAFVRYAVVEREAVQLDLEPGRYVLRLCGAPVAPATVECDVTSGQQVRVRLPARPATIVMVGWRHPGTLHPIEDLDVEVATAAGSVLWRERLRWRDDGWLGQLNLEAGRYRIAVRTAGGLHLEHELAVATEAPQRPLSFTLLPP
jgi:hypothetical protein